MVFHVSKTVEQLLKRRDGSTYNTEISPIAYALGLPDVNILHAIKEIGASHEPWPWSTDRFAMAVVICSIDNNNTTAGHLCREFSHLLSHFLTHGGERNA